MKRNFLVFAVISALALLASCGGGSSSSSSDDSSSNSLSTLSSVPSVDLSAYDYSAAAASSASADILLAKSIGVKAGEAEGDHEGLGHRSGGIGMPSRAGCEASMHKKEAMRMSQMAQLERCYFEAMEAGGLISIPLDSYNYYKIAFQPPSSEDLDRRCGDIPDPEMREGCMQEGQGAGSMLARIGRFGTDGNELRIDSCEGEDGSEIREGEATYAVSGSVYTGSVIRIGNWGGQEEKSEFTITVDASSVTNGVADLGSSGSASASGRFNGGFGQGQISFVADAATASNIVFGAFAASFEDPVSGVSNNFTGKTYAQFGGISNTGTAKFSFNGNFPAMSLAEMVNGSDDPWGPQPIPEDQRADFYSYMQEELGVPVNDSTIAGIWLCPNPDFDPSDENAKGMVISESGLCEDAKTDIESFSIANITSEGDLYATLEQSFAIILNSSSAFYDAVSAVDLDSYLAEAGAIVFSREWDCAPGDSGWTLEILPEEMMAGNMPSGVNPEDIDPEALQAAIQVCEALDEKSRENQGMGAHNCADQEMAGDAGGDFGGGGPAGFADGDDHGGMIPAPCKDNNLSPDDCMTYCDANPEECFEDGSGPPPGDQVPQACLDAGIGETDFQACGEFCQANPCF